MLMSFWNGALAAVSSGSAKLHSMLHSRIITATKARFVNAAQNVRRARRVEPTVRPRLGDLRGRAGPLVGKRVYGYPRIIVLDRVGDEIDRTEESAACGALGSVDGLLSGGFTLGVVVVLRDRDCCQPPPNNHDQMIRESAERDCQRPLLCSLMVAFGAELR